MWCFVRQFQTLIVGGLGFLGVMATLAFNAWLARRQHARTVSHEQTVVRVALRAELEAIAESYRDRIKSLDEPEQKHGGAHLAYETMTSVYRSMVPRVGLLTAVQVRAVLRAYLLAEQLPERLKFLADDSSKPEPGYVYVPARNFVYAAQMHRNYLQDIDAAITALSEGGKAQ